jgi:hypothetical protein
MLNYMYAILESESRLALAALGLDPAIGFLHMDAPARDSLACDLMEAVRPEIDAYLFDWVSREPLRRNWFFEESDGNCRLMGSFAVKLSETSVTWARAVAPAAEWVARKLWSTLRKPAQQKFPATRLTQSRRREAKGGVAKIDVKSVPQISRICRTCGADLKLGKQYCAACSVSVSRKNLLEIAKSGRVATHSPAAEMLRSKTQNRQREALRVWNPSEKPSWLTEEFYRTRIFPELPRIQVPKISSALRVSKPYATEIRKGRLPHPRHWLPLATLIGLSQE